MNNEVKGVSFPFRIGGRGGVAMSGSSITGQQHLKENIMSIVGTKEFERVMNPLFGLEDLDIFFADLNESTKSMASFKIREKLSELEDRVEIVNIVITPLTLDDGTQGNIVTIDFVEVDSGNLSSVSVDF